MAILRSKKADLRALMRRTLSQIPNASVAKQSRAITALVTTLPQYQSARRIGVYLSMPKGEVTTRAIVLDAMAQGKQVFVPYIYTAQPNTFSEKARKVMDMVSVHSREDYESIESHRDAWGIPSVEDESVAGRNSVVGFEAETTNMRNRVSKCDLDMIVMPGVAFDTDCGRLGHGKGFYDFFLQRYHDGRILEDEKSAATQSPQKMPYLGKSQVFLHTNDEA